MLLGNKYPAGLGPQWLRSAPRRRIRLGLLRRHRLLRGGGGNGVGRCQRGHLSLTSFTIAGTDDTDVEELLVVSASEVSGLEPDMTVAVTGTVREAFDLPTVEEELGVDWDDALYEDFDAEPYIDASSVDTSVPSDCRSGPVETGPREVVATGE